MKKLTSLRKVAQIFFLSLFVYVLWSTTYPLKGLISPRILFEIDPLIILMTAISERIILPGLLLAIVMIVLTMIFGRFFCGWVCPMGTVIDVVGKGGNRNKNILSDESHKKARAPKFILLYLLFVMAILGMQIAWVLDPIVITGRVVSLSFIPSVTLGLEKSFVSVIQRFELYDGFYDFYRNLKESVLGVNVHYFSNSLITFLFFIVVCFAALFRRRVWCRSFCPLGAMYSFVGQFSLLKRVIDCKSCGVCRRDCRMGAIQEDYSYVPGECVLCLDCVYSCKKGETRFCFGRSSLVKGKLESKIQGEEGLTRRGFLYFMVSSAVALGLGSKLFKGLRNKVRVLRPPGALDEDNFVNRCVRCGNCMKVCITNGLQPIFLQEGLDGVWTPQLVPEIGYCEYNCTLCGDVCPTGAIPRLSLADKKLAKIGTAKVNRLTCIPWSQDTNCLVCEEHCPVSDKAIKVDTKIVNGKKILRPVVDRQLCIGCGICQNKCPVRPQRAIKVIL